MKYRPEFPERFGGLEDTRGFCATFFPWYNWEHHHSAIGLLTPGCLHYGQAALIRTQRQQVLDVAFHAHPERFVRNPPAPPGVPQAVWINPPQNHQAKEVMFNKFAKESVSNY